MSVHEGVRRVRKAGLWVVILLVALVAIPGILTAIWLKIASVTITGVQFGSGHIPIITGCVVAVGIAAWILAGFAKN